LVLRETKEFREIQELRVLWAQKVHRVPKDLQGQME
jgi:hypothetical protein